MSFKKRIDSFRYAFRGIADLVCTQVHARFHLVSMLVVTAAGFYWHIAAGEWLAIVLCMALVISLEAMNTALEYLTDLVSPAYHPLAGKAKDAAAAAVLLAAIGAAIVGVIIFGPRITTLLF